MLGRTLRRILSRILSRGVRCWQEIMELKEALAKAEAEISSLRLEATRAAGVSHPPPPPPAPPPPSSDADLEEAREMARAATERAERAEAAALESKQSLTKLSAKLNAVSRAPEAARSLEAHTGWALAVGAWCLGGLAWRTRRPPCTHHRVPPSNAVSRTLRAGKHAVHGGCTAGGCAQDTTRASRRGRRGAELRMRRRLKKEGSVKKTKAGQMASSCGVMCLVAVEEADESLASTW